MDEFVRMGGVLVRKPFSLGGVIFLAGMGLFQRENRLAGKIGQIPVSRGVMVHVVVSVGQESDREGVIKTSAVGMRSGRLRVGRIKPVSGG